MEKEIKSEDIWNDDKIKIVTNHIKNESKKQSIFIKIKIKYLSLKYKIEDLWKKK